ncbi:MAG TPA: histidine kinase [Acidimicrobiales bacterium]|nr:histidine kinase [Acidimicrobiales bacterium]
MRALAKAVPRWSAGWVVGAALVVAVVGQLNLLAPGPSPAPRGPVFLGCILVGITCAALVMSLRWLGAASALAAATFLAYVTLGYPGSVASWVVLALLLRVQLQSSVRTAFMSIAVLTAACAVIAGLVPGQSPAERAYNVATVPFIGAVGLALRSRRAGNHAREQERRLALERALWEQKDAVMLERLRLARLLHDSVGHEVTLAGLRAEAAARTLKRDPSEAERLLRDVTRYVRDAMTELHQLVGFLRESDQEAEPLPSNLDLEALARRFRTPGLEIIVDIDADEMILEELSDPIRALVAEGLVNVVRHSGGASKVVVSVRQAGPMLSVDIRDNGRGPGPLSSPGFGITGVDERARCAGGRVELRKNPEGGAILHAQFDLDRQMAG